MVYILYVIFSGVGPILADLRDNKINDLLNMYCDVIVFFFEIDIRKCMLLIQIVFHDIEFE